MMQRRWSTLPVSPCACSSLVKSIRARWWHKDKPPNFRGWTSNSAPSMLLTLVQHFETIRLLIGDAAICGRVITRKVQEFLKNTFVRKIQYYDTDRKINFELDVLRKLTWFFKQIFFYPAFGRKQHDIKKNIFFSRPQAFLYLSFFFFIYQFDGGFGR